MRSSSEGVIVEKGHDCSTKVQAWNPPLVLNGSPLPIYSSIKDFQQGKARYVANALKQPRLLPDDIADLRTMKKHEVFLTLKRDLALINAFLFIYFT